MTSMLQKSAASPSGGLVEQAGPVIKQVADLLDGGTNSGASSDADRLRGTFEELFATFERRALRAGTSEGEVHAAKYALVALVDETILLSELPVKDEWLGRPLQMHYFDEFAAGEEFYNKLEALRLNRSPQGADVLEIYHLCMSMGFTGKYGDAKGVERRRVLMEGIAHDIAQNRGIAADAVLSPTGLPQDQAAISGLGGGFLARSPVWLVPAAMAAVLLLTLILVGVLADHQLAAFPSGEAVGAQP